VGVCDAIIERGYDLNIWAYARVDTVKPEKCKTLVNKTINFREIFVEENINWPDY
jgi:hypothetical protein